MRTIHFTLLCAWGTVGAQWSQLPDFPGTPRDDAAAFTVAGKIYVGTGREVGFGYTNDWFCFDPAVESWSAISSMPASGRQYCSTFTIADTGFVFGGTGEAGANSELWAYHPETDQWVQKASLPDEARYACVSTWIYYQDALVATGMLASGVPTNEAWKYRSFDDTWEPLSPVPGPARHRAACFESGGGMAILGGADSAFNALNDAWWYPGFFETGEWYASDDLPAPRYGADASGNSVYVLTCGASDGTVFHAETWKQLNGWEAAPVFEGGTRRGGVGAGILGPQLWASAFYFGLGLDGTFARRNDWWRLDVPVGVDEAEPESTFSIFPIPANDVITVQLYPTAGASELIVTTMDGRTVLRDRISATHTLLDLSMMANGSYLLTVSTETGSATQHFVVQR